MAVSEIQLYELLKAKIGEREAETFIQILKENAENKLLEKSYGATQEDMSKMLDKVFSGVDKAKSDIIKWRIGTSIAIIGLIVAILKLI